MFETAGNVFQTAINVFQTAINVFQMRLCKQNALEKLFRAQVSLKRYTLTFCRYDGDFNFPDGSFHGRKGMTTIKCPGHFKNIFRRDVRYVHQSWSPNIQLQIGRHSMARQKKKQQGRVLRLEIINTLN